MWACYQGWKCKKQKWYFWLKLVMQMDGIGNDIENVAHLILDNIIVIKN